LYKNAIERYQYINYPEVKNRERYDKQEYFSDVDTIVVNNRMIEKIIENYPERDKYFLLSLTRIQNEIAITQRMSDIGIAPKIEFISINGEFSRIIMDRYERTLADIYEEYDEIPEEIYELVDKIHEDKIVHRDLSLNNIVYKRRGNDIEYSLIDFGLSAVVKDINNIRSADNIITSKPT